MSEQSTNDRQPPIPRATPGSASGSSLVDLLDRVVDRGAVVNGDVIIQLAGIDLVRLDLRLLLIGIETSNESMADHAARTNVEEGVERAVDTR